MLCDHGAFMRQRRVPNGKPRHIPLRQSLPYQPTGNVFFFVCHFELTPFSGRQLSKVSARPTVFNWETYGARICTAVVYTGA